jgi:Fructose-1-6-bisphosphatase, N-terminal domain
VRPIWSPSHRTKDTHTALTMSRHSYTTMKTILLAICLYSVESYRSAAIFKSAAVLRANQPLYSTPSAGTPGTIMTLSRFMIEATRSNPDHADFESLMASIQIACKTIAHLVSRAGISDLTGLQASSKVAKAGTSLSPSSFSDSIYLSHVYFSSLSDSGTSGGASTSSIFGNQDMSGSLYELSNTVLKNALRFTGKIGVVAPTDEEDQPLLVEEAWNSKYVAVFDALDGASNIDVGIVTGTVFGIFKEEEECLVDFGENVRCVRYITYPLPVLILL